MTRALADYAEAIRLEPNDAIAHYGRGLVWCAKAEYVKAVADFDEAIRLRPDKGQAIYARGVAYLNMGETAKAKMDFARASKLGYKPATKPRELDRGATGAAPNRRRATAPRSLATARIVTSYNQLGANKGVANKGGAN